MKGKQPERCGQVSIHLFRTDSGQSKYYGRYYDRDKDSSPWKHLADNRDDARDEARKLDEILSKRWSMTSSQREYSDNPHTIQEAIAEALKARRKKKNLSDDHVTNLLKCEYKFRCFMTERFPAIVHWKDVCRVPHIRDFVEQCESEKLSPKYIRHLLGPISLTAKYMARTYEQHGYRELYTWEVAPADNTEERKNYLTAKQLEHAMAVALQEATPDADLALLSFVMGGWVGLNLMEVVMLKSSDFDFKAQTVKVQQAKNKYRKRQIPIPPFVCEIVQGIAERQKVVDVSGALVLLPEKLDNRLHQTLSRPINRLFKQAGLLGVCSPKDLRKSFINIARNEVKVERETLRRYVGHVPADIMSKNYEDFSSSFKSEIADKIAAFRENLCTDLCTSGEDGEGEKAAIAR